MKTVSYQVWSTRVKVWNGLTDAERIARADECQRSGHEWTIAEGVAVYCHRCLRVDLDKDVAA